MFEEEDILMGSHVDSSRKFQLPQFHKPNTANSPSVADDIKLFFSNKLTAIKDKTTTRHQIKQHSDVNDAFKFKASILTNIKPFDSVGHVS